MKLIIFGYFDAERILLGNENKWFSGWQLILRLKKKHWLRLSAIVNLLLEIHLRFKHCVSVCNLDKLHPDATSLFYSEHSRCSWLGPVPVHCTTFPLQNETFGMFGTPDSFVILRCNRTSITKCIQTLNLWNLETSWTRSTSDWTCVIARIQWIQCSRKTSQFTPITSTLILCRHMFKIQLSKAYLIWFWNFTHCE